MDKYNLKIHTVLSYIYRLRVLSYSQIYSLIFSECEDSYCHYTLRLMYGKLGLIEKIGYYREDSYFFLTRKGVSYLKKNGIIGFENQDKIEFLEEYYTASELKLNENIVSHQLSLNQFVIDFKSIADEIDYKYYDEIYISSVFDNIRPDGLLCIGDTCYFLEMDMNTERKSRLVNKWENYRRFVTSGQAEELNVSIKVLFILGGNLSDQNKRKVHLSEYIMDNIEDKISSNFNIFIDDNNNLIELILNDCGKINGKKIDSLLQWKGLKLSLANFADEKLKGFSYNYYVYKSSNKGTLDVEGGVPIEFIMDYYYWGEILTLKNIQFFDVFSVNYLSQNKRNINYLIVVNSVNEAYSLISSYNISCDRLYFITTDRLKKSSSFNEAIFKIEKDGAYYHFKNDNINIRIDEGKIKKLR